VSTPETKLPDVLRLSHELGREDRGLAMLGEGNTSVKLSPDTFLVKGSGTSLSTLKATDVVECRFSALLPLLDKTKLSDKEVDDALLASRVEATAKKPSVEALMHAYLLALPGVEFVGHTHAVAVTSILCSPRAREFATKRLFPDHIVCCDVASPFIPYTDPGLKLAQTIRQETDAFIKQYNRPPRVILMENHGLIALGRTVEAVLAAMLMAEKTAKIWLGAAALGGPQFMPDDQVQRITGRPDEEVRRRQLNM
jgi:rhamnose utilization protein RhaD (predicted bifunctional aldolase and dehydrogenase)